MSQRLLYTSLTLILLIGLVMSLFFVRRPLPPIKVGVLHATTGTMAISETPVLAATLLAIDEINSRGGVLGRRIEPIVVDSRSDATYAAQSAEQLIKNEGVITIFGCWTSACRKTVKPVIEQNNHLLLYPVQYEGGEQSPNIFYLGAAPNQQIIPAVTWSLKHLGRRVFLVGSDYIFPQVANTVIRDQVYSLGGEIVGDEYLLLGSAEVQPVIDRIVATRPDVIFNTINGDSNDAFFRALRAAGITADTIPTVSFSLAEPEIQRLGTTNLVGDYAAWNYFQSLDTPENHDFVARLKARSGSHATVSDPMEAAYIGVLLWAQAVQEAQSDNPTVIRSALHRQSMRAPEGIVSIDPITQHTWKTVRIAQIQADGQFKVVWDSRHPVRPQPYPVYRSRAAWTELIDSYYTRWGERWSNPGK